MCFMPACAPTGAAAPRSVWPDHVRAVTHIAIALLRGVNVGGKNALPMAGFRDLLSGLGLREVVSYIQSGNAVFACDDLAGLDARISDAINARFGFRPWVCVLPAKALAQAVAANPFEVPADQQNLLHLFFTAPGADLDLQALGPLALPEDGLSRVGDVIYLHTPGGFGRSKLAEKLGRVLDRPGYTARNLRTCLRLLDLAQNTGSTPTEGPCP